MSNEFIIKALKFNQDDYLHFLMQKVRDLRSGEIDYGEVGAGNQKGPGPRGCDESAFKGPKATGELSGK